MDVHEAIRTRRSVRDYGDTPIPDEALLKVLEEARLAPSSSNQKNWRFIVVKEEARRMGIAKAASNQMWIAGAPVIIAAVATEPRSIMTCGVPRFAVDLGLFPIVVEKKIQSVSGIKRDGGGQGNGAAFVGRAQDDIRFSRHAAIHHHIGKKGPHFHTQAARSEHAEIHEIGSRATVL